MPSYFKECTDRVLVDARFCNVPGSCVIQIAAEHGAVVYAAAALKKRDLDDVLAKESDRPVHIPQSGHVRNQAEYAKDGGGDHR